MNKDRRNRLREARRLLGSAQNIIEEVKTEEEIAFDNLSDGLQQTMRGETMEENVDIMEDAIEKIEEVVDLLDEIE